VDVAEESGDERTGDSREVEIDHASAVADGEFLCTLGGDLGKEQA